MNDGFGAALRRAGITRPWRQFDFDVPPAHCERPLIWSLDNFQWDSRAIAQVTSDIRWHRPTWIRIANFYPRIVELLTELADLRLNVLWKQEFWGYDTAGSTVPAAPGIDPVQYADDIAATGHNIVPYTFNAWNHLQISKLIPDQRRLRILPVAAKPARGPAADLRRVTRDDFGIPPDATLFGVGGLLDPEKGIEQLVGTFLATNADEDEHLLCALVVEWEDDYDAILTRWRTRFGDAGAWGRLHIHVGGYGDWQWMSEFYAACDYVLVNSRRDSAPRIVSEPVSLGVPTIAVAAECGTNHLVPDLVIVNRFDDFTAPGFRRALGQSRENVSSLARQHRSGHCLDAVRGKYLSLLTANANAVDVQDVRAASRDPASLAILDELAAF